MLADIIIIIRRINPLKPAFLSFRWVGLLKGGESVAEGAKIKLSLPSYLEQTKYLVSKVVIWIKYDYAWSLTCCGVRQRLITGVERGGCIKGRRC